MCEEQVLSHFVRVEDTIIQPVEAVVFAVLNATINLTSPVFST